MKKFKKYLRAILLSALCLCGCGMGACGCSGTSAADFTATDGRHNRRIK